MNREEAIKSFAINNYVLLTNEEIFDKKLYKDIKRTYFIDKNKNNFGVPRDKEICDKLIELLIKQKNISSIDDLDSIIKNIPFFRLHNIKASDYEATILAVQNKFDLLSKIKDLGEIEKLERQLEYLTKEKRAEFEMLLKQKREEISKIDEERIRKEEAYKRLPSILDAKEYEEPKIPPKEEKEREWWEKLNLRENPFPGSLDGFHQIEESLFDEIIIETLPIIWAIEKIKKEKIDIFHKGFLLDGEFGTGKTTFFDFISPRLIIKHIEPLRIALSENISVAHYTQSFEREMSIKIAKIAKKYSIPQNSHIINFEEARLLMLEIQGKGAKGFAIFIDDLHKHIDLDRVFNFLANLQIIKNTFSRDEINVAFIVSGLPLWRDKIENNQAVTGFFDAPDRLTLPAVTPEVAAQAIKKRLQAFSINPKKDIAISEDYLGIIFRRVSREIGKSNIGFRPYIKEAVSNFQESKFDILSIDYTKLDEKIVKRIRATLEGDKDYKYSISRLLSEEEIKTKEFKEKALKVLCEIFLRDGIKEDHELFNENLFIMKKLSESRFIQKYQTKDGALIWKISPFIEKLNSSIIDEFNLSLEDYLVPIYFPSEKKRQKSQEVNKAKVLTRELDEIKNALEPEIANVLGISVKIYINDIMPFCDLDESEPKDVALLPNIETVKACIWGIMKCIIKYESPLLLNISGESNVLGWTLRHRRLEASDQFLSSLLPLEKTDEVIESDKARLVSFAHDAFMELWEEMKTIIGIYKDCHIKPSELPLDALETIHSEFVNIFNRIQNRDDFFKSANRFIGCIEKTIRKYLHVSSSLIFGPFHLRQKYYPDEIKKYMNKNMPTTATSYEGYNEYESLNRGQYRTLFTQAGKTSDYFRFIIKPIIDKWSTEDIESFFNIFGDTNIATSHLAIDSIEKYKKDMPTLFRLASRLISSMSLRLRELMGISNTVLLNNGKTFVVFAFRQEKDGIIQRTIGIDSATKLPDSLYRHDITDLLNSGMVEAIAGNSDNIFHCLEINMLDIEGTMIKLDMNYNNAIALIAFAIINNKIRFIPLYGTNIYLTKI